MTFVGITLFLISVYPLKYVLYLSFSKFVSVQQIIIQRGILKIALFGGFFEKLIFIINEIFGLPFNPFNYGAGFSTLTLDAYIRIINDTLVRALINSFILATLTSLFNIMFIPFAAYAFSRFKFIGRGTLLYSYLLLSQVAGGFGIASIIALIIMIISLENILGIHAGYDRMLLLSLIYFAGGVPFNTWMVKSYYDTLPRELEEAALIDGANFRTLIFKVIMPAFKPAIIILAIFGFMSGWGDFILAAWLLPSNLQPISVIVFTELNAPSVNWNMFAAKAMLYSTPLIILFTYSQRYIGEVYRTGFKG